MASHSPPRPLARLLESARATVQWAQASNDLEATARGYQMITRLDPTDIDAAKAFVDVLLATGRTQAAAIELLRLAALYASEQSPQPAIEALEHAWVLDPKAMVRQRLPPVLVRLGAAVESLCRYAIDDHTVAGRFAEARDLLLVLIGTYPERVELRQQLAELELELGNPHHAARSLRHVMTLFRARGDRAGITATAEQLLRLAEDDTDLLNELVTLELQADRPEQALGYLERLGRLAPHDQPLLERTAILQARLGRTHAALESLWKLVRLMRQTQQADHVRALLRRAWRWHSTQGHRRAVDALARAVLSAREASELGAPGWVFFGNRPTGSLRPPAAIPTVVPTLGMQTRPLMLHIA